MQSHPFTVASWSPTEQGSLKLFIEPRKGFTSKLLRAGETKKPGDDASLSYLALFTGPHGICFPVWDFKTVLMFATGFGIVAMLPYLENLIHGHKYHKSRTRRIHLVWHVEDLRQFVMILDLLNECLKDDAIGKGYVGARPSPTELSLLAAQILHISIYNECRLEEKEFGKHGRAAFFVGAPDLRKILNTEENGDFIQLVKEGVAGASGSPHSPPTQSTTKLTSAHTHRQHSNPLCSFPPQSCVATESDAQMDVATEGDHEGLIRQVQRFQSDKGKVLVLGKFPYTILVHKLTAVGVSGTPELRDELRKLVRSYLSKRVRLKELDYQPRW